MQIVLTHSPFRDLFSRPEFAEYDRARAFIDENFHDMDSFTVMAVHLLFQINFPAFLDARSAVSLQALGSIYLAHRSLSQVQIWDFEREFFPLRLPHYIVCDFGLSGPTSFQNVPSCLYRDLT